MSVSPQNVARFYHIWLALLNYVNDQLHLDLDFPEVVGTGSISMQVIQQLRDSVWAQDGSTPQELVLRLVHETH